MTNSITEAHVPTRDVQNSFEMGRDTASTCYLVGVMLMFSYDKPFITAELKTLHRKKCREYYKHGKSVKYLSLKRKFDDLYKYEAKKYLTKTVNELKFSNPGKMYSILKRLGSKPSESESNGSFSLPLHLQKNLSNDQSAEIIAEHFAAISQEFSPLIINVLPDQVKAK